MKNDMKRYNIVARADERSAQLAAVIRNRLGEELLDENDPATVFVVGGDGTFLKAVHQYLDRSDRVAFIAIHTGTLGFFTDYLADEIDTCLADYQQKAPRIVTARLLGFQVGAFSGYAVNEMRIENVHRTQFIDVYIDDTFFETFRGTGMCISTQLGSTAYNRSLNGAIIAEGLELIELQEITGIHHRAFRSLGSGLILPASAQITFKGYDMSQAVLCYDHKTLELTGDTPITCQLTDRPIRFARYRDIPYLKRLNGLF